MFAKLLIANRGEIACRVIRTAHRMGIATVAVHSDADARALHVAMADEAVRIGPAPALQSYLDIEAVLAAVRTSGADAVHPGYGFLSENPRFAAALDAEGIAFVGPPVAAIEAMGDKITSKRIAAEAGVTTVPGHAGVIADADEAVRVAREVGYPVMIKASAGGGGKGMRIARDDSQVREGFAASQSEAAGSFGDDRLFIERFVTRPRHIEIQVLADAHGNVIHLNERECSIQRRNQKVIEEAPSPFLDAATRAAMGAQACALARSVGYVSAGTVEFIVDEDRNFYFLEMNTRLQVEHPVTELITGVDLVEQMIRVAAGERLALRQDDVSISGWAVESRVYAEDPCRSFLPSAGRLTRYRPPDAVAQGETMMRIDTGVVEGSVIGVHYDPMIAKLCTWAPDRAGAVGAMAQALDAFEIEGIAHNLPFLSAVMANPRFRAGEITTAFIDEAFPGGFAGVQPDADGLRRIAAAAATMHRMAELRRGGVCGRIVHPAPRVGDDWAVLIGDLRVDVTIVADGGGATVAFGDGPHLRVESDWRPGGTLARLRIDGAPLIARVSPISGGYRLRTGGADLSVLVLSPRHADLAALMPARRIETTSDRLLCPMPGTVLRIDVAAGDTVEVGQTLCTVEAMKMENTLRAERPGTVTEVRVGVGDSLAVDDVILMFTPPPETG